jgi:hypothetical protein
MSIIVIDGVPVPTKTDLPEELPKALPPPQILIARSSQRHDAWCYAAAAEMAINYCFPRGLVDQCQVVTFVKGTQCCGALPAVCTNRGCRKDQLKGVFKGFHVNAQELESAVSPRIITTEVTTGRGRVLEVIIDWQTTPNQQSSHAVLLSGIIGRYVYVVDPLPEAKYHGWRLHTDVVSGFGGGHWSMTLFQLKAGG